ncbi:unnamed protein product, partial [Polarella glacialis]
MAAADEFSPFDTNDSRLPQIAQLSRPNSRAGNSRPDAQPVISAVPPATGDQAEDFENARAERGSLLRAKSLTNLSKRKTAAGADSIADLRLIKESRPPEISVTSEGEAASAQAVSYPLQKHFSEPRLNTPSLLCQRENYEKQLAKLTFSQQGQSDLVDHFPQPGSASAQELRPRHGQLSVLNPLMASKTMLRHSRNHLLSRERPSTVGTVNSGNYKADKKAQECLGHIERTVRMFESNGQTAEPTPQPLLQYRRMSGLDFQHSGSKCAAMLANGVVEEASDEECDESTDEEEGGSPKKEKKRPLKAASIMRKQDFFQALEASSPGFINALAQATFFASEREGQVMFRQGDAPLNCYVLTHGKMCVLIHKAAPKDDADQPSPKKRRGSSVGQDEERCPSPRTHSMPDWCPTYTDAMNRQKVVGYNVFGADPSNPARNAGDPTSPSGSMSPPASPWGAPLAEMRAEGLAKSAIRRMSRGAVVMDSDHVSKDLKALAKTREQKKMVKLMAEDEGKGRYRTSDGTNTFSKASFYGNLVMELGVGTIFGELALKNSNPRAATIMCQEDCEVLVINAETFKSVVQDLLDKTRVAHEANKLMRCQP